MCLDNLTKEIYVLNLKKRDDRLAHITRELKKIGCNNYSLIESVDGSTIENPTTLKNGQYGLIKTYFKIYELFKETDSSSLVIIEDDCVFSKTFCEEYKKVMKEIPDDWKLIYFGGNHNSHMNYEQPKNITDNVIKLINTYSAHFVVIERSTFFEFISELKNKPLPIDVLLSEYQKKYPAYSSSEKITWQINNFSDIEDRYINYDWMLKK